MKFFQQNFEMKLFEKIQQTHFPKKKKTSEKVFQKNAKVKESG